MCELYSEYFFRNVEYIDKHTKTSLPAHKNSIPHCVQNTPSFQDEYDVEAINSKFKHGE